MIHGRTIFRRLRLAGIALGTLLPGLVFAQSNTEFLASPKGRYVVGQVGDSRSDQYLLDTHTGRLWQLIPGEKRRPLSGTRSVYR